MMTDDTYRLDVDVDVDELTVMCTTRGERRLISIRCKKECVENKLAISYRMLHNLITTYHVVQVL